MKIVFGFSRPKHETILSKGIRWIEKRPYSHAYVRLQDPYSGQQLVFQASSLQVNLSLFEMFKLNYEPVREYELDVPDARRLQVWNFVLRRLGVSYSMLQLVWIFVRKLTGHKLKHNNESAEICSELAARTGEFCGMSLHNLDFDYTTPSNWDKICASQLQRIL